LLAWSSLVFSFTFSTQLLHLPSDKPLLIHNLQLRRLEVFGKSWKCCRTSTLKSCLYGLAISYGSLRESDETGGMSGSVYLGPRSDRLDLKLASFLCVCAHQWTHTQNYSSNYPFPSSAEEWYGDNRTSTFETDRTTIRRMRSSDVSVYFLRFRV
jgi:hypothetical protein